MKKYRLVILLLVGFVLLGFFGAAQVRAQGGLIPAGALTFMFIPICNQPPGFMIYNIPAVQGGAAVVFLPTATIARLYLNMMPYLPGNYSLGHNIQNRINCIFNYGTGEIDFGTSDAEMAPTGST